MYWPSFSQTRNDSIRLIQDAVKYYDLDFTSAEVDSMLGGLKGSKDNYARMHQQYPPNQLPFPFAFNPAPIIFIETNSTKDFLKIH